jgi:hypothetical protein
MAGLLEQADNAVVWLQSFRALILLVVDGHVKPEEGEVSKRTEGFGRRRSEHRFLES